MIITDIKLKRQIEIKNWRAEKSDNALKIYQIGFVVIQLKDNDFEVLLG